MRENGKTWYRICKMLCEYKKYFPGIICCLLGSSFITFIHPLLIRQITDCGILQKNMKYILLFSVILIIISLTQQELNIIQTKLFSNVHNQFTHSLYKKTYWKINRMKIQYFAERGSAEIINTIGMDIDNVSSVVDQITQFSISSILQIIGGVVGLSLLDWKLAILIEAIIPLKFIIVSYCANKKREVFEQWIEDKRKFMSWFAECINGIHEMKLWNLFQVKKSQFEGLQKDLMDSYKKNAMLDEYSTVSVVVIDTVVNALLYILSGLFIIKGEFTIGGAFAFITYNIDGKASRDAVVEACRKSGALGFIEKLDHGFGQKIGQDGAKLSGGERQKIAVARALLKNADILLMDEATEGFDVESNEALRELLHSELKNKTIVFITHKYKELESVDKVYRLSKGILELVRS